MLARVAAGLSVVAASLAVASSAQADILVTDVTTPASQSFVVSNPLAGNSNRLLIEGTTNDDDGQLLDVYCTYGAGSDAERLYVGTAQVEGGAFSLNADLNVGLGLMSRWDIGLSLPQILAQSVESDSQRVQFQSRGNTEVRLNTKVRLLGDQAGGIAVVGTLSINRIANNPYAGSGAGPTARFDPPGLLFFDLEGTRLLLDGNAPSSMLYLEVPDVVARVEELRDRVEVVTEPHQIFIHEDDTLGPAGAAEWQAFIKDSEGNLVGLVGYTR